jgi:DNA-binding MarR family transcriptional regulator
MTKPPPDPAPDRPPDRVPDRAEEIAVALFAELFMIDQLSRSRIRRALPKGMDLSHFMVLNHLARTGEERTPAQLARAFQVTRGAMTNRLARLEWAGHVHIRPDWDDARRKRVAISPAGRAAREAAVQAIAPLLAEAVAAIGTDRVRAVLPVLRELRARFERM